MLFRSHKDSEHSGPVAKRGLGFAASRGENVTRNINAVEEKVAHNPTTELRNINLQENSIPSSQWNGLPLPRQLFPFYSILQPPLTVVPIVNFSRPVVKTLSLLIEYNTGLISCTFHPIPSKVPRHCPFSSPETALLLVSTKNRDSWC